MASSLVTICSIQTMLWPVPVESPVAIAWPGGLCTPSDSTATSAARLPGVCLRTASTFSRISAAISGVSGAPAQSTTWVPGGRYRMASTRCVTPFWRVMRPTNRTYGFIGIDAVLQSARPGAACTGTGRGRCRCR